MLRLVFVFLFSTLFLTCNSQVKYPDVTSDGDNEFSPKISNHYLPVIGVWVWGENNLAPEGFKKDLNEAGVNSPVNLLVTFLRFPDKEVVDQEVFNQVKLAAEYAAKKGIGLLPDIDVRSARRAFKNKYPGEQQQMLRLKETRLLPDETKEISVVSIKDLNDHYSGGNIPKYNATESNILRIYGYSKNNGEILPASVTDITDLCEIVYEGKDSVRIRFPVSNEKQYSHACAMVSFTLFYPDVFGPHLIDFQREIIEQYGNLPLAGACKDEWGFPPYYPRYYSDGAYDFWFSEHMAKEYSERTGGRELLSDCFLMGFGSKGKKTEREVAINHFMEMIRTRNVEIENDFYRTVKDVFGPDAAVTVHSTWWPYPDFNEFRKNGLSWWAAQRDWAQTDELTPFGARTAISKKWDSPIWYNMYYTDNLQDQVWGSVLGGGRINYLRYYSLFDEDIMQAENRIRLLNYISQSPLDCRVAVVFGHPGAMNWASQSFNDVGMKLVDTLWYHGYPTDLIPTSEIENGSLKIDDNGYIHYGKQRYSAVVLYQPELEKESTSLFFQKAKDGQTALFRIGDWNKDFEGNSVDQEKLLPENMRDVSDYKSAFPLLLDVLRKDSILPQTPATSVLDRKYFQLRGYDHTSYFPPNTGFAKLIDGTRIMIAASEDVSGDTIQSKFSMKGYDVFVDAIGVVGVRLDENGELDALVAGGLNEFARGDFKISLDKRTDIALWKNGEGKWKGVIQAYKPMEIPDVLKAITTDWEFLKATVPPK
jgi:hypothetical protein